MSQFVDATVSISIGGKQVLVRTVSIPTIPKGVSLSDEVLEGFLKQTALKVLPSVTLSDPKLLRQALEECSE